MKNPKSILLGTLVAAVVVGTIAFQMQRPRIAPVVNAPEEGEVTAQPPSALAMVSVARTARLASATRTDPRAGLQAIAPEPADALRVSAGDALANVNDKAIQLKDLASVEAQETEKMITPEEYESRLNRAVEMELTFQEAAAQGVDLSAEQKKRLDGLARKQEATLHEYQKQGITWSSLTAAQLEFERRLTSALMLQRNLVAKEAGLPPDADSAVQAVYEQALRQMLDRLKANARIIGMNLTL